MKLEPFNRYSRHTTTLLKSLRQKNLIKIKDETFSLHSKYQDALNRIQKGYASRVPQVILTKLQNRGVIEYSHGKLVICSRILISSQHAVGYMLYETASKNVWSDSILEDSEITYLKTIETTYALSPSICQSILNRYQPSKSNFDSQLIQQIITISGRPNNSENCILLRERYGIEVSPKQLAEILQPNNDFVVAPEPQPKKEALSPQSPAQQVLIGNTITTYEFNDTISSPYESLHNGSSLHIYINPKRTSEIDIRHILVEAVCSYAMSVPQQIFLEEYFQLKYELLAAHSPASDCN